MKYFFLLGLFFFTITNYSQFLIRNKDEVIEIEKRIEKLSTAAVTHFRNNDLKKSTELLFQAKFLAETTNNYELIIKINGSIAHQYVHLELYNKAIEYLNIAIKYCDKLENSDVKNQLKCLTYLELGNIAFDIKSFKKAKDNYSKSLFWIRKNNLSDASNYLEKRSLYNIGKTFLHLNVHDSTDYYLNEALNFNSKNNSEFNLFIKNTISQLHYERKDYESSINTLTFILHSTNLKDDKLKAEVYYNLSKNYKALSNDKLYLLYLEKYTILETQIKKNKLEAINKAITAEQSNLKRDNLKANYKLTKMLYLVAIIVLAFLIIIFKIIHTKRKEIRKFKNIINNLSENNSKSRLISSKNTQLFNTPSTTESEILEKLEKFEKSYKYINPKLNISNLAVQLKSNTTYLSEVINKYKGKNYNSYINELRINFICEKIYNDPEFQKYKISYLAEYCGFSSHSAFTTVFKNVTGISPSVFLQNISKSKQQKNN